MYDNATFDFLAPLSNLTLVESGLTPDMIVEGGLNTVVQNSRRNNLI